MRYLLAIGLFLSLSALALTQPGAGQTIPPGLYLPLVIRQDPPTATPTPTATATTQPVNTATPTPTLTPTATATMQLLYICDRDAYNCSNFNTQAAAQTVYNYCAALGFGDIHKLDNNNDGEACESLP
jgi:hypothetical protein